MKTLVWLVSVKRGKNVNWLQFEAFTSRDNNRLYRFEYCGTDVDRAMPLTDEQYEVFISQLNDDYGYAPYKDIVKYQNILGSGRSYEIN